MKRLFRFLTILTLSVVVFAASIGWSAEKPNVILIMADDVGFECFGSYGSEHYQTPHLDRMAREGMRFVHCYSQPLCTPSRVKIMTGISNVRNYSAFSVLNPDQKTIGHMMQSAGYRTLVAGKWQLLGAEHYAKQFRKKGSWPKQAGFDEWCLWQVDKLGSRYWEPLLNINGENKAFPENDYGPDIATRSITDFLEKHAKDEQPMFVYYPMILVHNPFLPTPRSESRKQKDKQKNFEDMVAYMDEIVGRIVQKTEDLGIAKNTLIIFTADNGTNKAIHSPYLGKTIRGGKGSTTDSGTREPFIAYWPGKISQGVVNQNLIDFSDVMPTLAEVAGVAPPQGIDGQSFLPQLLGKPGTPRKWMFCYYNPRPERTKPVRFTRDQTYKLYRDGRFYNITEDASERSPLTSHLTPKAILAKKKLQSALDSMPAEGQQLLKFVP